ncbi:UxaA family hydrolase [Streptomyces sp. NPDC060210]|uniref:UxaA family hydrolase n=1 Tax=Streptomyces sp. NPDC060210 TaxID=3347074 RepID=UPI003662A17F
MTASTPAGAVVPLVPRDGADDVGLVRGDVERGTPLQVPGGTVAAIDDIPAGHKVAVRAVVEGAPVHKYGEVIGVALRDIPPGAHVHQHNLGVGPHSVGVAAPPAGPPVWTPPAAPTRDHFLGYRRADGRAATRNYIAVLPTVNCSSTVARMIAHTANARVTAPSVDGVIALTHDLGCGMAEGTAGDDILRRTLRGYAGHANVAGVLVVSLGCEINQPGNIFGDALAVETLVIQDLGGTAATVNAARDRVEAMAARIAGVERVPVPVAELTLGLQCGGSDAYSGLTANPALGVAADLLGPVRPVFVGPERLARRLAALSESAKYVQYEADPPPCDPPRQTSRADPRRSTGQDLGGPPPGVVVLVHAPVDVRGRGQRHVVVPARERSSLEIEHAVVVLKALHRGTGERQTADEGE